MQFIIAPDSLYPSSRVFTCWKDSSERNLLRTNMNNVWNSHVECADEWLVVFLVAVFCDNGYTRVRILYTRQHVVIAD